MVTVPAVIFFLGTSYFYFVTIPWKVVGNCIVVFWSLVVLVRPLVVAPTDAVEATFVETLVETDNVIMHDFIHE